MSLLSQFWDLARHNVAYYASALWGQGYSFVEAVRLSELRYPTLAPSDVERAVRLGFSSAETGGILGYNPVFRPSPSSMQINPTISNRFQYVLNVRCQQEGTDGYRYFQFVHDTDTNSNFNQLSAIADMYMSQVVNDDSLRAGRIDGNVYDCGLYSITSVLYRGS